MLRFAIDGVEDGATADVARVKNMVFVSRVSSAVSVDRTECILTASYLFCIGWLGSNAARSLLICDLSLIQRVSPDEWSKVLFQAQARVDRNLTIQDLCGAVQMQEVAAMHLKQVSYCLLEWSIPAGTCADIQFGVMAVQKQLLQQQSMQQQQPMQQQEHAANPVQFGSSTAALPGTFTMFSQPQQGMHMFGSFAAHNTFSFGPTPQGAVPSPSPFSHNVMQQPAVAGGAGNGLNAFSAGAGWSFPAADQSMPPGQPFAGTGAAAGGWAPM